MEIGGETCPTVNFKELTSSYTMQVIMYAVFYKYAMCSVYIPYIQSSYDDKSVQYCCTWINNAVL